MGFLARRTGRRGMTERSIPMDVARVWTVARPFVGAPTEDCFELRTEPLAAPADGELLIENLWLSVEPSLRIRIAQLAGDASVGLHQPLPGRAIGRVRASRAPGFAPGDLVQHGLGWRDKAVAPAEAVTKVPDAGVPVETFLGVLGYVGLTAYTGIVEVARVRPGDVVFVSGAAGGVGSTAVQLARVEGASRVIGSAGGPRKADWLRSLGCDAVIDYRAEPDLSGALARAAPDGIDVYFDNVGGDHLAAAFDNARTHARFAECGMVGAYNSGDSRAPAQLFKLIVNRIRMEGFGGPDIMDKLDAFQAKMIPLVKSGVVRGQSTVLQGLEATPAAFIGLFSGANTGKMLVQLSE